MIDRRKKLTAGQVKLIREEKRQGRSLRQIARKFKISNSHVCNIVAGIYWK